MSIKPSSIQPFNIKAAWKPETLEQDQSWVFSLSEANHTELLAALSHFKTYVNEVGKESEVEKGLLLPSPDNFPLPVLGLALTQVQDDLENGYGLSLIENFPLQSSDMDNRLLFGGLLSYIGTAQVQTVRGELLQAVRDEGQAHLDERRGSKHNLGLPIHNDGCDVVGFLCKETPLAGGETILVSAALVHNEMLEKHPEALAHLYQPYENAWQDYMYPGGKNTEVTHLARTWTAPIFSTADGKMCCRYSRFYTDRAQEFKGVKPMSPEKINALDVFDSLLYDSSKYQYRRQFKKGDVMFVNNHVLFHSRTAYVDGDSVETSRHLYRAWMATPNSRNLDPAMACFFGNVGAGEQRGGVKKEFLI